MFRAVGLSAFELRITSYTQKRKQAKGLASTGSYACTGAVHGPCATRSQADGRGARGETGGSRVDVGRTKIQHEPIIFTHWMENCVATAEEKDATLGLRATTAAAVAVRVLPTGEPANGTPTRSRHQCGCQ